MSEPIEELYFDWLCAKVLPVDTRNYHRLMQILYCTEFVWFGTGDTSGDRNRTEDGLELRDYFLDETGWDKDPMWFNEPCSLLEFFIALADRAYFMTDKPVRDWFWTFMSNLGLDEYRQVSEFDVPVIENILYTFVWREYDSLGRGGLFPLSGAHSDQRQVEIWYQFNAYVADQGLI